MTHRSMKVPHGFSEVQSVGNEEQERKCRKCGNGLDRPRPKTGPDHLFCSACLHDGSPTLSGVCTECGFEMDKPVPLRGFHPEHPLCLRCTSVLNAARERAARMLYAREDYEREDAVSPALIVDADGTIVGDIRTDHYAYGQKLRNTGEPKHEEFAYAVAP
jgi:hypothetical protein